MTDPRTIGFYDTTLRDGEQMPGITFDRDARVHIAAALDAAGLDEIEIGFAASGEAQQADMRAVARLNLRARTLSIARPIQSDIDAALAAEVKGVIVFASVSDLHLQYKVRKTFEEVVAQVETGVAYARRRGLFVQLSIEDATRTPDERLAVLSLKAVNSGAERVGLADTVGIATPELMGRKVVVVKETVSTPISVHCHDDFGMAVANSLAAVRAGASMLSTTMLGLGERAGNAATEECAAALELLMGYRTNIELTSMSDLSRLVAARARVLIPANKAVIGRNCFRHESGVHVAAVLQNPDCYEGYDPARVGARREIVLGKTNGKATIRYLARQMGEEVDDALCMRILGRLKVLAERGELEGAAGESKDPDTLRRLISELRS